MNHRQFVSTAALSIAASACFLGSTAPSARADVVWSGLSYTFELPFGSDWTLPVNQDRITPDVWITRGGTRGIFNIHDEDAYSGIGTSGESPVGTEWAFGTTADYSTLTYTTWAVAANGAPSHMLNRDMVLHLTASNTYIDIRFLSWGGASFDGSSGFSYIRAVPAPTAAPLLGLGLIATMRRRR